MKKLDKDDINFDVLNSYEKIIHLFESIELENDIKNKAIYNSVIGGELDEYDIAIEEGCNEIIDICEKQIIDLFDELFSYSHENNFFYFDCPFKVYKNHFAQRKKNYMNKYLEANEIDFLSFEIEYFENPQNNRLLKGKYMYNKYIKEGEQNRISLRRKLDFLYSELSQHILNTKKDYSLKPFNNKSSIHKILKNSSFNAAVSNNGKIDYKKEIIKKPKSKYHSFTYINNLTGQSNLTALKESLITKGFIAQDTDLKDFRKVFSGQPIENPIVWTGNISELSYFIKQLHNNLKYVVNVKLEIWVVTINCFIQENGEQYNRTQLRTQKVPSTSKNIDSVLNTLK